MLSVARKAPPAGGIEVRLREAKERRSEPLRQSAKRQLDAFQTKIAQAPPASTTKPKKPKSYKTKRSARQEAMARTEINKLVTKEAQRKGDYQFVSFKLQEVTEGGKRIEKETQAVRNLGATQVERWARRGKMDERQLAAVLFYQQAWTAWIGEPRVVANYSPAIARNANGAVELWASSRMRAREGLRLLDQEVFFREPTEDFWVWQNVVIWDMPAGQAGGHIGFCYKPAEAVAQRIVTTLAGKIADIVIDSSRRDFGDLLIDIDAPRRPGRRL